MEIILSPSQGFCAGVTYAIAIVEQALKTYGPPLYVYHEIVHNTFVVNDLRQRGVIFTEDIEAVPPGARLIFSAHGVPPRIVEQASRKQLIVIDATCPLVKKVHHEAERFSKLDFHVVLIGHRGHQEMIGTAGYVQPELLHIIQSEKELAALNIPAGSPIVYLTQTTLSIDETRALIDQLKAKFPQAQGPAREDICYATQKRQDAVKTLAKQVEMIIVCGSSNSSNSNRLRETALRAGVEAVIIDNAGELDFGLLEGKSRIGISSGASVPRKIVDDLIQKILQTYPASVVHGKINEDERPYFPLPRI